MSASGKKPAKKKAARKRAPAKKKAARKPAKRRDWPPPPRPKR